MSALPSRCAYRSSARTTTVVPKPPTSVSRSSALSLACLAASGLTTAGVLGSLELAALAAAGAAVAGAHAWRMRRALRVHDSVIVYLGSAKVVRTRLGWCSRDGTRRVRRSFDGRLIFEELAADGTARVFRGDLLDPGARLGAAPSKFVLRCVYMLHGRALRPACFLGLPTTLGGTPHHVPAEYVRLEESADAVRLLRVDARGHDVGETLHLNEADAARQLRNEYGSHLGPLRVAPPKTTAPGGWEGDASGGVGL